MTTAARARATDLRITAGEVAALVGGRLEGPADLPITGIAAIESGGRGDLTFVRTQSFAKLWQDSACSAVLVTEGIGLPDRATDAGDRAVITVPNADTAFAAVLARMDPGTHTPPAGVHPSASVDPTARVASSAAVGPSCTIGPDAVVGEHAVLIAGVFVGAGAVVGERTVLHPGVVIGDRCTIGRACIVHPNAVIGAEGFGYIPAGDHGPTVKIPQIGTVCVGDDCEIGAGTTIDRAKFGVTSVGQRVKIDNLVHIAHNCTVGDDSILCGRTTLGGSASIGKRALIGGAVTIADQAVVGDFAKIVGGAIVMDSVPANETYAGIPAMPARTAMANHAAMRSLAEFMRRVEKTLARLTPKDEARQDTAPAARETT
tara:strand:+ start:718 stop:1839 length:1122 start_codon:yes stop_codon:yes gene_type:complete